MATWKVEPTFKKSVIERNYMRKDDNVVMVETGWRWGEFLVYTDDDNPPEISAGVDIYNCDYETELLETWDGCWEEQDYDDCDDETREWLEEFFDEGNSWLDLEEHGWSQDECEMIIDCELKMTKVNDDGTDGEVIMTGVDEDSESTEIVVPDTSWPFDRPKEPPEYAQFKCTKCDFSTEDIDDLVENEEDDDRGAYLCPDCGSKVDLQ